MNPYLVLGVPRDADDPRIRRAYIEAESEREIIEELEETAKQLPPPPESDEAP